MRKKKYDFNRIKPTTNCVFNVILAIGALICILPVIFIFMISITSDHAIAHYGYQIWPKEFSLDAYKFLWREKNMIFHSLYISVLVTILGVVIGVSLTTMMGYVMSRPGYKLKKVMMWIVFIPMIFNGGMFASYVVNTKLLMLKNTIWALVLPLLVSSFNIVVAKTFFRTTIPDSLIESAKVDGASQLRIFLQIVLPISTPLIATLGIFLAFGYWNDWFQSSLYISDKNLISLQALLDNIMKNIQYLANNPSAGASLAQYRAQMPQESVRMAIAIVIVVPIAAVYPFFQRYFIKGLTVGAVKG